MAVGLTDREFEITVLLNQTYATLALNMMVGPRRNLSHVSEPREGIIHAVLLMVIPDIFAWVL